MTNSWKRFALGEVAEISAGNPAPQNPDDFASDGFPFVRMQDVGKYGHTTNLVEVKDRLKPSIVKKLKTFSAGSILVPKSGASIRLNHRAILGMDACVVSHLAIISPNPETLNNRFAYYWLCTQDLAKVAHDAQMPSLKTSELAKVEIPLPPLPEQERVVRLLDEAEGVRKLRSQASTRMEDFVPALFHEMFGDVATNPKKWKFVTLESVAAKEKNSMMRGPFGGAVKKEIFVSDGYKIYEQKNAIRDDFEIGNYFIDTQKYNELSAFAIQGGDLIVSCSGTIGKIAIVPGTAKAGIINQALMKIRPNKEIVLSIYLKHLLETNYLQHELFGGSAGSAIQNVKPLKLIKQTMIPLPPLDLQREFARRVNEAREVQSAQRRSEARVEALYQSMLGRAFGGAL